TTGAIPPATGGRGRGAFPPPPPPPPPPHPPPSPPPTTSAEPPPLRPSPPPTTSAEPPPTPPGSTGTSTPTSTPPRTHPPDKSQSGTVYWNAWEEEGIIGPRFSPAPYLKPATEYKLFVDLATLAYKGGVAFQPVARTFNEELTKWVLSTNEPTLRVKTILLV